MKRSSIGLVALVASAALILSACGGGGSDDAGATNTDDPSATCGTFRLLQPIPESILFWPLITSTALGYFEDEGLEVVLLPGGGLPETAFVENGEADIATAGGPEVMQALDAGADLKVLYDYWNVAAEGIVTLGSGTDSIADVKTIGLVSDSDAATIEIVWAQAGLDPSSVTTITLGESPAVLAESLENGTVDAVAGAILDFIGIQAAGVDLKEITPSEFKSSPSASFIVTPETISSNGECTGKFLRAWAKGTYAGLVNAEATQAMGKAAVPEEWIDEATGIASYDQAVPANTPVGGVDAQFGVVQKEVWQAQADSLIAIGELDFESLDVSSFIDEQFIDVATDWDRAQVKADIDAWAAANTP